jgi:hypothetical protein
MKPTLKRYRSSSRMSCAENDLTSNSGTTMDLGLALNSTCTISITDLTANDLSFTTIVPATGGTVKIYTPREEPSEVLGGTYAYDIPTGVTMVTLPYIDGLTHTLVLKWEGGGGGGGGGEPTPTPGTTPTPTGGGGGGGWTPPTPGGPVTPVPEIPSLINVGIGGIIAIVGGVVGYRELQNRRSLKFAVGAKRRRSREVKMKRTNPDR